MTKLDPALDSCVISSQALATATGGGPTTGVTGPSLSDRVANLPKAVTGTLRPLLYWT
jgi:hypothetical protein